MSYPRAFVVSLASGLAVLSLTGQLTAQERGPDSLQPDVFITIALQHDTPVARGNILVLPSPYGHATSLHFGKNGATTAVTPSTSTNVLNLGSSSYSVGSTVSPTLTALTHSRSRPTRALPQAQWMRVSRICLGTQASLATTP